MFRDTRNNPSVRGYRRRISIFYVSQYPYFHVFSEKLKNPLDIHLDQDTYNFCIDYETCAVSFNSNSFSNSSEVSFLNVGGNNIL